MQQASDADDLERDIVLPVPLVAAAAIFVVYAVLAALDNAGTFASINSAVHFDRFYNISEPLSRQADFEDRVGLLFPYVNRMLFGFADLPIDTCGIVLALAFIQGRGFRSLALILIGAPLPGQTARRPERLVHAEILIAILAVMWTIWALSGIVPHSIRWAFPAWSILCAVAFWGALPRIAWHASWPSPWNRFLTAWFALLVLFSVLSHMYFGDNASAIVTSLLFGTGILCISEWFIERCA